ncbi:MAG: DUF479 domain-containing protein [Bacteroidetes bacterium]|nr:MAG: DUF479 domain-containing protein [Bacteroidota bacterium]
MNLLGHLYFSQNDQRLMYANLYGDFFKGNDFTGLSPITKKGILLHRTIDDYIDHHPAVLDLLHKLYPDLPKVSGIAVDLYFDHLLAQQWQKYHPEPLDHFLEKFYLTSVNDNKDFSPEFNQFIEAMRKHNWISHYPTKEGLQKMCNGVSSRISFPNVLSKAPVIFEKQKEIIERTFELYMQDAKRYISEYLVRTNG